MGNIKANSKISIITPSFNRADIVGETAESIFNQTNENWEWVIVDDGSTDDSWEVLESYSAKDDRVKVYKRDREPKGACTCRNIAVEKCSGDYVMFLDTDDILAPFCVEQRLSTIAAYPDCDFVIFPMLMFKETLDDMNLLWNIDKDEDDLNRLLIGDPICQGTGPLWRRQSFVDIGMWREDLKLWQDVELHIRSLLKPVKYAKRLDLKPDVFLRVSDGSLSRGAYNSVPKLTSRIDVLKYTLEIMLDKNLQEKYKQGLRLMSTDIILSAINTRMYDNVTELLDMIGESDIYSERELKTMQKLLNAHKMRLYKISFMYKPLLDKVRSIMGDVSTSLLKVKYQPIV